MMLATFKFKTIAFARVTDANNNVVLKSENQWIPVVLTVKYVDLNKLHL